MLCSACDAPATGERWCADHAPHFLGGRRARFPAAELVEAATAGWCAWPDVEPGMVDRGDLAELSRALDAYLARRAAA